MKFSGLGIALITPFTQEGDVDYLALEKLVEYLIVNQADYIVVFGTTAESVNLSKEEKIDILDLIREINNNRVPLVLGIGGNNTHQVVSDIEHTDFNDISAILSVSPYYNKPSQEGIFQHYKTISKASPLPIIMYNVPNRTSSNMTAVTTLRLASEFENIVAIKEASADFNQVMHIIQNKPRDFTVISGDDALTFPMLSLGVEGVISVIGNAFPGKFSRLLESFFESDIENARKIQYELFDFINLAFEEGSPTGIKTLLNLMGFCEKKVRLPLWEGSEQLTYKMKQLLEIRPMI